MLSRLNGELLESCGFPVRLPRLLPLRLVGLILGLSPLATAALDFHVSPGGNDTWTGRPAAPNAARTDGPLASLDGARRAVRRLPRPLSEPVHVIFAEGVYRIEQAVAFEARDSGEIGCVVSYEAAPGADVVISGGRMLPTFLPAHDGRWELVVPTGTEQFEQLWVDGHRAIRARAVGQGYPFLRGLEEEKLIGTVQGRDVYEQTVRAMPADLQGFRGATPEEMRDAVVTFFHKWDNTRRRVEAVDLNAGTFTVHGEPVKPHNPLDYNTGFILENLPTLLDRPAEWFLSRAGRLTYLPRPGDTVGQARAVYPVADKFLTLAGEAGQRVEYLRFQGLKFWHAKGVASLATFEPNQAAVRTIDGVITLAHARQVVFANCELAHFGSYGFSLQQGCREVAIDTCLIADMGAGGVKVGTLNDEPLAENHVSHNRVYNCIIRDGGVIFPCAVGVWIGSASDNEVTHNEISDLYYSGISVGWRWGYAPSNAKRNRIEQNHLHHLGRGLLSDLGGVYTLGPSEGTTVSHNLIHDVTCFSYGGWGIYTDEGSSGIIIEGNVVYNTVDGGFHQHYGRENIVRNNIFAFGAEVQIKRTRAERHRSFTFERNIVVFERGDLLGGDWSGSTTGVMLKNNLYWNYAGLPVMFTAKSLSLEQWQQTGQEQGSIIADPLFENPAARDFRLKADSPARAMGFQPIDVATMGVVGDAQWRKRAETFDRGPELPRLPKPTPPALNIRQTFEGRILDPKYPFPHATGSLAERVPGQPEPGDGLRLTGAKRSEGKMSLLFLDAPNLPAAYLPMLTFFPNHQTGTSTVSFDLYLEPKAIFSHEWRDKSSPYQAGPSLQIKDGKLGGVKGLAGTVPLQQWVHFELVAELGAASSARWTLRVTPAGGATQQLTDLPFRSAKMKSLDWVGFMSNADEKTEFYLDNLSITTTAPGP